MRKSVKYVVFLLYLDAAALLFEASGAAEDMGIEPALGAGNHLSNAMSSVDSLSSQGGGETLFAVYSAMAETAQGVFKGVFAGPIMLDNLGVPTFLVTFIFVPATLISGLDILYVWSGRDV